MSETSTKTMCPTHVSNVIRFSRIRIVWPIIGHFITRTESNCEISLKLFKNKNTQKKLIFILILDVSELTCRICWTVSKSKECLKIHYRDIHSERSRPFICEFCNKPFKSINTLRNHKSLYHRELNKKC